MARMFKNPSNGHIEEVGGGDSAGALFLGALYLAIKGLWGHVFIWLVIVVPLTIATGGPGIIIFLPLASIIYAFTIQSILANVYLNNGWQEVDEKGENVSAKLTHDEHDHGEFVSRPATSTTPGMKKCPYCAEEVKAEAIKCKHCQSELSVSPTVPVQESEFSGPRVLK